MKKQVEVNGEKVRREREKRAWTQEELSEKTLPREPEPSAREKCRDALFFDTLTLELASDLAPRPIR